MLATLIDAPFEDDDWLFEIKWDGVRALAVCSDETVLLSRNGNDVTATYPELQKLHQRLVAIDAIVDGEIVAMAQGRPSFERLQSRINLQNARDIERGAKAIPVSYVAYDLLYLDGKNITGSPLEERRRLLGELVVPADFLQVSHSTRGDGEALFEVACNNELEGIVAKKLGTPYRPGKRTREWLKVKTVHQADVVIGGWSKGEGARSDTFGSLLVGAYTDEGLSFVGSVGTGFTDARLQEVLPMLRERETDECPFSQDCKGLTSGRWGKPLKDPHWVRPELVAQVEFRELTSAGKLRAPSFKGLRSDKAPHECRFEELTATTR